MSVCPFILFLLSCEQIAALRLANHSSKESYRLFVKKDYETEEEARAQQRAAKP
jgi:hypothetical protein